MLNQVPVVIHGAQGFLSPKHHDQRLGEMQAEGAAGLLRGARPGVQHRLPPRGARAAQCRQAQERLSPSPRLGRPRAAEARLTPLQDGGSRAPRGAKPLRAGGRDRAPGADRR